ncbi:hypothetical protein APUTEX25_000096 [Auxenochlorella protothecoides]|uniref:2-phosphoglycerate kinase n=2 Tax=Auxenochlorella protothecoides TaxID=3075 RepID=A0A3M7KYB5_AUXPR|nr:hypothetical protein APUTEX25_000096 [Auxenochlorella protothecoides]|eukprot:RMZ55513.1 hypothetical protein APUTEX25_000096 [Auxenochlorella protothecoides]
MPGSIPRPTYLNLLEVGQHEPGPVRYSADQLRTCLLLAGWKPKLASRAVNRVFLLVQERLALAPADPASLVGGLREACPGLWEASLPRSDLEALLLGGFTTQAPDSTLLPDLRSAMSLSERRTSVTILLCGTSGTGKSTLASLLAGRLGIPALLSTDAVRHALRAFSTDPLLAASSYACGPLVAGAGAAPGDERGAAVRGFKAQCAGVAPGVERLAAAAAVRRQSMVVEGVHLRPGWAAAMAARLTSPTHHVLPFLVCIANEAKHAERFAVRSKTMTLRPDANRYVRHLRSIRVIQDHLLRDAGAHLIPVVNNTNVDRSLATIHATHDPMRSALIKACALGLLGLAAIRTAPLMASHGVGHTLQLLDAKEPFLVRAGLGRLHFLLNLESTHRMALESQAVPRILSLLDQPRIDPGVAHSALEVLLRLAERQEGREALLEANVPATLATFVARIETGSEKRSGAVLQAARELALQLLGPLDDRGQA